MPPVKLFKTCAHLRRRLQIKHATSDELWVGLHHKGSRKPSLTWPNSVDEALIKEGRMTPAGLTSGTLLAGSVQRDAD